jgi:copper homeostasis protein
VATLEICVESVTSALAAFEGGADRVELCADLAVGGVTPRAEAIALACLGSSKPVHVLIRPREGDFVYDDREFEVMCQDVEIARERGASGVVLGILRPDGTIDRERLSILVGLARPLSLTFHKAFDEVSEPFAALDVLVGLGFTRILTSGQAPTARQGLSRLEELARYASGRITILAGGRVRADDLSPLIQAGLSEIHVGSAVVTGGRVDADKVRRFVTEIQALVG